MKFSIDGQTLFRSTKMELTLENRNAEGLKLIPRLSVFDQRQDVTLLLS